MKRLVVLSGKGGTGKTSVTGALADLASRTASVVLVDADVDAANLELLLDARRDEEHPFESGEVATIDARACGACGECLAACRFGAIDPGPPFRVNTVLCEGCRACTFACPTAAIGMLPMTAGAWYRSTTRFGPLFHARLTPGRENSGKLVTRVREAGTARARETGADLVLIDGPPGIGCPVIAALTGADLALLVVEPTVSGAADLERALNAVDHFGVPAIVALNKADLNPRKAEEIGRLSAGRGVEMVGSLPFDDAVPRAMRAGVPVSAIERAPVCAALASLWRELSRRLENRSNDSGLRVSGTGMATLSAGS